VALNDLGRYDGALLNFDRAIALKPDCAEAHKHRGTALKFSNRVSEALASFECAIKLSPDIEFGYGSFLEAAAMSCNWDAYEEHLELLRIKINERKLVAHPLAVMWLFNSPDLQRDAAEIFARAWLACAGKISNISKYLKHEKIRIGYFSGDFFNHAVSILMAELFEQHDRTKFELIALSSTTKKDEITKRIERAFDRFIDVSKTSERDIALMARGLEIDIAIDLAGFTSGARSTLFDMRVAPIQVNYLGYPGTMGADYIDYIIADATIIPTSHQQYYSEKVAYLPSFQVNDTKREISDRVFTRDELGLPPTGFVFCCLNNTAKINPAMFDSWMRILKQVEGSVLWMLGENATAINNLVQEAKSRGVEGSRIIFAKRETVPDYLARYRMADIFLDTLPFNAGTTASDALWAGLPVLTQIGETFAGRMAASLLNAIELPELITTSQREYEALAIELATHSDKLQKIKQKLAKNQLTTRLFDIENFTRSIENAYTQMYQRHHAGLPPDHIVVE
jgi:predicted O-linked N-acetylglucosamine transferase (SPINDLY family)